MQCLLSESGVNCKFEKRTVQWELKKFQQGQSLFPKVLRLYPKSMGDTRPHASPDPLTPRRCKRHGTTSAADGAFNAVCTGDAISTEDPCSNLLCHHLIGQATSAGMGHRSLNVVSRTLVLSGRWLVG